MIVFQSICTNHKYNKLSTIYHNKPNSKLQPKYCGQSAIVKLCQLSTRSRHRSSLHHFQQHQHHYQHHQQHQQPLTRHFSSARPSLLNMSQLLIGQGNNRARACLKLLLMKCFAHGMRKSVLSISDATLENISP